MSRSRFPRTILVRLCDESNSPIYVLDHSRTIVYCNPACENWLKCTADDLIGRVCRWQSDDVAADSYDELPFRLCPSPEIMCGQAGVMAISLTSPQESIGRYLAWGQPLGYAEEENCVLVVVNLGCSTFDEPQVPTDARVLHRQLTDVRRRYHKRFRWDGLAGESPQQQRVRRQILLAGKSCEHVLLVASIGMDFLTVAQNIHDVQSAPDERATRFTSFDCSLIDTETFPENLRLFASRRAEKPHTLLLVDVDKMPRESQAFLLEWITTTDSSVRIVAASRHDLLDLGAADKFCFALAFRLASVTIRLPDLHERMEDVPILAQQMVEALNQETGRQITGLASDAVELLLSHAWPGQLEELNRRIAEAYQETRGPYIRLTDFLPAFRDAMSAALPLLPRVEPIELEPMLQEIEARYLRRAVQLAGGNKTLAARLVGMNRPKFLRRWEQLMGASVSDEKEEAAAQTDAGEDDTLPFIEFEEEPSGDE